MGLPADHSGQEPAGFRQEEILGLARTAGGAISSDSLVRLPAFVGVVVRASLAAVGADARLLPPLAGTLTAERGDSGLAAHDWHADFTQTLAKSYVWRIRAPGHLTEQTSANALLCKRSRFPRAATRLGALPRSYLSKPEG